MYAHTNHITPYHLEPGWLVFSKSIASILKLTLPDIMYLSSQKWNWLFLEKKISYKSHENIPHLPYILATVWLWIMYLLHTYFYKHREPHIFSLNVVYHLKSTTPTWHHSYLLFHYWIYRYVKWIQVCPVKVLFNLVILGNDLVG